MSTDTETKPPTVNELEDKAVRAILQSVTSYGDQNEALTQAYYVLQKGILLRKLNSLLTADNAKTLMTAAEQYAAAQKVNTGKN